MNVEGNTEFVAMQEGHPVIPMDKQRADSVTFLSSNDKPVVFCFKTKDGEYAKKVDFYVVRNSKHSAEAADLDTLDSVKTQLAEFEKKLEVISINIQR